MLGQFDLLYSADTLREYVRKLKERGVPREDIKTFIKQLRSAELVFIEYYHQPSDKYPSDPDDIPFILCADNGKATHVISYDEHLLELAGKHSFTICKPVAFLKELRDSLE